MSFNTIDLNAIHNAVNNPDGTEQPLKSRYPLMVYPNAVVDVSMMRGMYVCIDTFYPSENKPSNFAIYVQFNDGSDIRISPWFDSESDAKQELDKYTCELWAIMDDLETKIPSFLK